MQIVDTPCKICLRGDPKILKTERIDQKKSLTTLFANSSPDLSRFFTIWGLKTIFDAKKAYQGPTWLIWAGFERFVVLLYTNLVFFVVKSCEKHIFDYPEGQILSFDPQMIDFDVKKA